MDVTEAKLPRGVGVADRAAHPRMTEDSLAADVAVLRIWQDEAGAPARGADENKIVTFQLECSGPFDAPGLSNRPSRASPPRASAP